MRFHIFLCMLIFLISAISINSAKKHQRHTTTIEPSLEEDEQPQRPMHMRPRPPMPHRPHHHRPMNNPLVNLPITFLIDISIAKKEKRK
uniref:Uncharacterized protein n=1 Tax=Trichogramma kaykai TaxID=54128 RepID=A0ABD2VV42_9HYME